MQEFSPEGQWQKSLQEGVPVAWHGGVRVGVGVAAAVVAWTVADGGGVTTAVGVACIVADGGGVTIEVEVGPAVARDEGSSL